MSSLAATLHEDYQRFAGRPCVAVKRNGVYQPVRYAEMERRVAAASLQLLDAGVSLGDRVAIVAKTRLEWLVADQAVAMLGAVVVPVYPTLTVPVMSHILRDSGATVAIVEGPVEGARVAESAGGPIKIFTMDPWGPAHARFAAEPGSPNLDHPRLVERRAAILPGTLVSFLYTSGTTGMPKGVLYDHARARAALESLTRNLDLRDGDVALSFLPMSHALGRGSSIAYFHHGVVNHFGESLDTVAADFQLARPTVAFTVPRVFEKAHERILTTIETGSPAKKKIFHGAIGVAREAWTRRAAGRRVGPVLGAKLRVADRVVFRKIRGRLGGRVRVLWSGGASLAPHIAEFFSLVGINIRDVYGMSEFGLSHMTPEGKTRFGSCGRVTQGFEARIAPDGEILVRTSHGMLGYHQLPEDTREFREPDGWMHTGDIGHLDPEGFLFITDRKKSLIVLSNGKKVAPTPIESKLQSCPWILQAVVMGEGRSWLCALVYPNRELAAAQGFDAAALEAEVKKGVDAANADLPSFEQVKRFALLEKPLSEADGDLTPTLKIKRNDVARKNAAAIDRLYLESSRSGTM